MSGRQHSVGWATLLSDRTDRSTSEAPIPTRRLLTSYGNRDALGAGSPVPEPPIPLWFPVRVAALDHDAFVVDSHNSRIVQVHLKSMISRDVPVPE
jgi:hypothetical protein